MRCAAWMLISVSTFELTRVMPAEPQSSLPTLEAIEDPMVGEEIEENL
jgi:hypothetical protein